MNQIKTYCLFLLWLCFDVYCGVFDNATAIPEVPISFNDFSGILADIKSLNGTFTRVTKKYECKTDLKTPDQILLLHGRKAWTFPSQDVNLTLKYPSSQDEPDYLITKVTVILYLDGSKSTGYIGNGGLFRNHIEMTFTVSDTSRLAYQFWLYGVHRSFIDLNSHMQYIGLC